MNPVREIVRPVKTARAAGLGLAFFLALFSVYLLLSHPISLTATERKHHTALPADTDKSQDSGRSKVTLVPWGLSYKCSYSEWYVPIHQSTFCTPRASRSIKCLGARPAESSRCSSVQDAADNLNRPAGTRPRVESGGVFILDALATARVTRPHRVSTRPQPRAGIVQVPRDSLDL